MDGKSLDAWIVGMCAGVFLLSVHGPRISPASARTNDHRSYTLAIKEYDGSILLTQIVDDRIVTPVRQLKLSERCFDLALSPDGKTLAYTHYADPGQDFQRFIELLDIESGEVRRLTGITSNNSYNPRWSHDGRHLAVDVRTMPGIWDVGVIGADNKDFRIVTQPRQFSDDCQSPIWGPRDASIYCGGMDKLHEIDLSGFPIRSYSLKALVPKAMVSVPWTMDLSGDGRTILFETQLPDSEIRWHTGGRGTIYTLDLSAGVARRANPENFSARCPAWLDGSRYLFLGIPLTKGNHAVINRDALPKENLYLGRIGTGEVFELRKRVWEFSGSSAGK